MRVTFTGYALVSVAVAVAVVANAFRVHEQFYTTCTALLRSNMSITVLLNIMFLCTLLWAKLLQRIFFGRLRTVEVEHLSERLGFVVSETCLAMTMFRDEFDARFLFYFMNLFLVHGFHWLLHDRVDYMEQSPTISRLFHIRFVSLSLLLAAVDVFFFFHAMSQIATQGASMMLFFSLEYAVMFVTLLTVIIKYGLHCYDLYSQTPHQGKSVYIFYLEFVADFIRMVLYIVFFAVIFNFYGFPLHLVRNLYRTIRSFVTRLRDLIQYRRATSNMNERYPDATPEELASTDRTCIICREDMETAKRLPCGHLFHFHCLRSWLERQQTCPTCRTSVLAAASPRPVPNANAAANAAANANNANADGVENPVNANANANANNANNPVPIMVPLGTRPGTPAQQPQPQQAPQPQQGQQGQPTQPSPSLSATQLEQLQQQHRPQELPPGISRLLRQHGGHVSLVPFSQLVAPPDTVMLPFPVATLSGNGAAAASSSSSARLNAMSTEELLRMEGIERTAILARLRFLQSIEQSLATTIAQLQQYEQLTAGIRFPVTAAGASAASSSGAQQAPQAQQAPLTH